MRNAMRTLVLVAALVLAVVPVSGCLGPDRVETSGSLLPTRASSTPAPPPDDGAASDTAASATATIRGLVADLALRPIAGARVVIQENSRTAVTDSSGAFAFPDVAPGVVTLAADADGFETGALRTSLDAGDVWEPTFRLLPVERPVPFQEQWEFQGFFECSATYLIITGDCFAAADYAAEQAGLPPPGSATNEKYEFQVPVRAGWETIVVEETWEPATAATDPRLRLLVEPLDVVDEDGHSVSYAETGGEGPLRLEIRRGEVHETAQSATLRVPDDGDTLRLRSFVQGELHHPGGTNFLGVGAAFQQQFTIYVTVFYLEAAPEGFALAA